MSSGADQVGIGAVYGVGWKWPVTIEERGVVLCGDSVEDIKKNLKFLFHTQPGERLMRPDFGCDLNAFMFENYSKSLVSAIEHAVRDSVAKYEPRVRIDSVVIDCVSRVPLTLDIHLNYHIHGSTQLHALSGEMGGARGQIAF